MFMKSKKELMEEGFTQLEGKLRELNAGIVGWNGLCEKIVGALNFVVNAPLKGKEILNLGKKRGIKVSGLILIPKITTASMLNMHVERRKRNLFYT